MSDNPGDEAQLREALKCIAESRSDHVLLNFLETGSAVETVMNLDAAFERLGVTDRNMPDEDIIAVFKLRVSYILLTLNIVLILLFLNPACCLSCRYLVFKTPV